MERCKSVRVSSWTELVWFLIIGFEDGLVYYSIHPKVVPVYPMNLFHPTILYLLE